jgi:hypothetical protein
MSHYDFKVSLYPVTTASTIKYRMKGLQMGDGKRAFNSRPTPRVKGLNSKAPAQRFKLFDPFTKSMPIFLPSSGNSSNIMGRLEAP